MVIKKNNNIKIEKLNTDVKYSKNENYAKWGKIKKIHKEKTMIYQKNNIFEMILFPKKKLLFFWKKWVKWHT